MTKQFFLTFISLQYIIKLPFTNNLRPLNQFECRKKQQRKRLHFFLLAFDPCPRITSPRSNMKPRILLSLVMVVIFLLTNAVSTRSDWFLAMTSYMLSVEAFSLPKSSLCLIVCFWTRVGFITFLRFIIVSQHSLLGYCLHAPYN